MSTFQVVSSEGCLNTAHIQKELLCAIAEDHTYRVTDEAKKRHIATAASYDEFRHFVACADQKRVSRSEMESLSQPQKGWQVKTNLTTGNSKNTKGKKNGRIPRIHRNDDGFEPTFPTEVPKNSMEFERDWRRHCTTPGLKLKYLRLCGPKKIRHIFKTEVDVRLLVQFIEALSHNLPDAGIHLLAGSNPVDYPHNFASEVVSLLSSIAGTGRFSLNMQFLDDGEREHVRTLLEWLQTDPIISASSNLKKLRGQYNIK